MSSEEHKVLRKRKRNPSPQKPNKKKRLVKNSLVPKNLIQSKLTAAKPIPGVKKVSNPQAERSASRSPVSGAMNSLHSVLNSKANSEQVEEQKQCPPR
jgi:hypothetical protein